MQERADCALQSAEANDPLQVLRSQDPTVEIERPKETRARLKAGADRLLQEDCSCTKIEQKSENVGEGKRNRSGGNFEVKL